MCSNQHITFVANVPGGTCLCEFSYVRLIGDSILGYIYRLNKFYSQKNWIFINQSVLTPFPEHSSTKVNESETKVYCLYHLSLFSPLP